MLIVMLLMVSSMGYTQDRYAVHYRYKPQTGYSLDVPEDLLLEKALTRRLREGVAVDSTDLPVAPNYLAALTSLVERIEYHSKWLNASVVVATEEQMTEVAALPFVDTTVLVARGYYAGTHDGKKENLRIPVSIRLKSKTAEAYRFQNEILGIPAMHEAGFTGAGVTIAVFDAGFTNADKISGMQHLFEQDRIVATRDFVTPGSTDVFRADAHGTASLSVMAANEPEKLVAAAFNANYILCITEDVQSEYKIEEYNWVRAAEFADSLGADIINSSLGYNIFDDAAMNYSKKDLDGKTAVITRGATLAAQKGILVVSSAGNEGNGSWKTITAPADAAGILAVGSVTTQLERSSFSSTGPTADGRIKPDLAALGSGVTIWRQVDNPGASSGTSFSSPQVAALAAGLWEARPEWTKEQLIERLLASGSRSEEPDSEQGHGVPNFVDAYYGEILELDPSEMMRSFIYPNPLNGNELFIRYGSGKECYFRMISTQGQIIADQSLTRSSPQSPYQIRLPRPIAGLYFIECRERGDRKNFRLLIK